MRQIKLLSFWEKAGYGIKIDPNIIFIPVFTEDDHRSCVKIVLIITTVVVLYCREVVQLRSIASKINEVFTSQQP